MIYRLQQLVRALNSRISPQEQQFIAQVLSPQELRLFKSMPRFDQRHCLDVAQTLQHSKKIEPALLCAALLHDTGKIGDNGRAIPLIYYGLFVVLRQVAPFLYRRAATIGRGPLWPFTIHANHEQRSVMFALTAGSSPEVVAILRDYAARQETEATRLLAWADDLN